MSFTIIKKGQQPQKATLPDKTKSAPQPTLAVRNKMQRHIWGVVGWQWHRDGTVTKLYNSVPVNEASPWLRAENK